MLIADYRALQRADLRDAGMATYFSDPDLDGFHRRALDEYARWVPRLKPYTLVFQAGVDTVTLPADWADVHSSFADALGLSGAYRRFDEGYGTVYRLSEALAAPTAGMDADFSGWGYPGLGYLASGARAIASSYTFLGGQPPQLVIRPAPTAAASFPLFYCADYILPTADAPGSLADRDSFIVLDKACQLACDALLGDTKLLRNQRVGELSVSNGSLVASLTKKSGDKQASFERYTSRRPLGSIG